MIYLRLFWEFFKTGLFAIGGGMATLPFLQDMSAKTGWFSLSDLADMVAISESTPGPIGVNTATAVGYTTAGIPGAVIATMGLVCPSIIIILIIAKILQAFRTNRYVESALCGIRPASTALMSSAALSLMLLCLFGAGSIYDLFTGTAVIRPCALILFAVLLALSRIKILEKLHPIVYIIIGAVAGILFF